MATHVHSAKDDLDRTDELPRLDVAAYEASLADSGISRESPWLLRHELDESGTWIPPQIAFEIGTTGEESGRGGGLTANVDRILKRIADLEAEILTTQETNAALQQRGEMMAIERGQLNGRIESLEAENARLSEQRVLAQEMAEREQQKLRSRLQDAEASFEALEAQRTKEAAQAQQSQAALQQRIEDMQAHNAALLDGKHSLQEELTVSRALADRQAQSLAETEEWLTEEKATSAQMTRQFAAKLTEYDKLLANLERHTCTIEELDADKRELEARLQQQIASCAALTAQLEMSATSLGEQRSALQEREHTIAQRDAELTRRATEIDELKSALETARRETDETQAQLFAAREANDREALRNEDLRTKFEQARSANEALETERTEAVAKILSLTAHSDALHARNAEMSGCIAELERSKAEQTSMFEQLTGAHDEAQRQIARLGDEREELSSKAAVLAERAAEAERLRLELGQLQEELAAAKAAAQADVERLVAERDRLMSAASELEHRVSELAQSKQESLELREQLSAAQDVTQDSTRLLAEKAEELSNIQTRLRDQEMAIRGLELAVRARDELAGQLRTELQTMREERSIQAGQLEKSRTRVKTLTQEIFRRDNQLAELRAELAVHTEALAAIRRDVNRIGGETKGGALEEVEQTLEPIEHAGASILLSAKMITIGRTTENDVCIPSKLVSRHHARLLVGPTGVIVEDAGSTNGCFVNGEQVRQHLMHEGDVLEIGGFRYRLRTRTGNDTHVRGNVVPMFDSR